MVSNCHQRGPKALNGCYPLPARVGTRTIQLVRIMTDYDNCFHDRARLMSQVGRQTVSDGLAVCLEAFLGLIAGFLSSVIRRKRAVSGRD